MHLIWSYFVNFYAFVMVLSGPYNITYLISFVNLLVGRYFALFYWFQGDIMSYGTILLHCFVTLTVLQFCCHYKMKKWRLVLTLWLASTYTFSPTEQFSRSSYRWTKNQEVLSWIYQLRRLAVKNWLIIVFDLGKEYAIGLENVWTKT